MSELHAIREELYEETKNMTPKQRLAYEQRDLDDQVEKLGITLKRIPAGTRSGMPCCQLDVAD